MKNKILRLFVALVAALVMFLQLLINVPEVAAAPQLQHVYVREMFQAKHSDKCLDVTNWSKMDGAPIQQWTCSKDFAANQEWNRIYVDSEYFVLFSKHSGLCLDASGGSIANGTSIIQWGCHMDVNQQFKVVVVYVPNTATEYFRLVNRKSQRCLDVTGASLNNGARIQLWDCGGWSANQLWSRIIAGLG